jgi:cytochrome c peroxidase
MNASKCFMLIACSFFWVAVASASEYISLVEKERLNWKKPKTNAFINSTLNQRKISIGRDLFFDTRLSGDHKQACSSCHSPSLGWSDGLAVSVGNNGIPLKRTSPTILDVHKLSLLMWDGRAENLQQQALLPITSADEMNLPVDQISNRIAAIPSYKERFDSFYKEGVTLSNILDAIAKFETTIRTTKSRFDLWVGGDNFALTKQELLGFEVFLHKEKGNCVVCHQAPDFTDQGYHNIGLVDFADKKADLGRFAIKPISVLKGAFRTPALRDIAITAPYFHDGSAINLEAVVDYYIKGGNYLNNLSPEMKPIDLSKHEKNALIAFLKSLSSI